MRVAAGALLALSLVPAAAAAPITLSTVSVQDEQRINRQPPPNAEPVVTDATLEKSALGTGFSMLPLPAFTYNRNEGAWMGVLAPLFRANAKGQVEDIVAPLYLHNDLIGETFAVNYFGYRRETVQFHATASVATKVERDFEAAYKDIGAADGRYILLLQASSMKSAFNRFYGFGNNAPESAESNFTLGDINVKVGGGVNLTRALSVLFTERYRQANVENGVVSRLRQLPAAFPATPGINGATIWGQGLTLAYDTRDNQLTPLTGAYATLTGENCQDYETDNRNQYWRVTADARRYWLHAGGRAVFVSRLLVDSLPSDQKGLVPQGAPFYERPTLGGETTLRGFGRGRFVGNFALLLNLEERLALVRRAIMGSVIELSVAPFLDLGRVGQSFTSERVVKNMQFNPGVGVRMLARPNIASRLDVAFGKDGPSVFVGLDYPF